MARKSHPRAGRYILQATGYEAFTPAPLPPGGWLKFFLTGVYEVAQEATATARRIVNLREQHRDSVQKMMGRGAANGLVLLERLYYRPIVAVKYVAENMKLTFATANDLVKEFVDLGILAETTGRQRNRQFRFEPYLALFREGTEP